MKKHKSKIKKHIYERGKKIDMQKLSVDALRADYPYKNAQWVWDNWTVEQRKHFLDDHGFLSKYGGPNNDYSELEIDVESELKKHINEGRYEKGGKIESEKNYERIFRELNEMSGVSQINATEYGVEIIPYNTDTESYSVPIKLTGFEILTLFVKYVKKQFNDNMPGSSAKALIEEYLLKNDEEDEENEEDYKN